MRDEDEDEDEPNEGRSDASQVSHVSSLPQ